MELEKLVKETEQDIKPIIEKIDEDAMYNSQKVLRAFQKNNISEMHFNATTGYGYDDKGREAIEKIFAEVLSAEDSLVRNQFISGTHALTVALFGILRPNDTMLSITGKPYDTLDEVIGITENPSSLKSFGVKYKQIELNQNEFDTEKIIDVLKQEKIKMVYIQRSRGYSTRDSITIEKIQDIIAKIRKVQKDAIVFIDNCYTEFVERKSPLEAGADIIVRFINKKSRRRNGTKSVHILLERKS